MIPGLIVAVAAAGLYARRARRLSRSPRELVSLKLIGGVPTTVVAPRVSLVPGALVVGYLAIVYGMITVLVKPRGLGLVLFVVVVAWLLVASFLLASGRMGDRTVLLTRDSITQRFAGVEQSVRWDHITAVDFTRVGIDLYAENVAVRRTAPVLWTGRTKRPDGAMRLQLGDLLPRIEVELAHAVHVWIESPQLRDEIGTSVSVHRIAGPEEVAPRAT